MCHPLGFTHMDAQVVPRVHPLNGTIEVRSLPHKHVITLCTCTRQQTLHGHATKSDRKSAQVWAGLTGGTPRRLIDAIRQPRSGEYLFDVSIPRHCRWNCTSLVSLTLLSLPFLPHFGGTVTRSLCTFAPRSSRPALQSTICITEQFGTRVLAPSSA